MFRKKDGMPADAPAGAAKPWSGAAKPRSGTVRPDGSGTARPGGSDAAGSAAKVAAPPGAVSGKQAYEMRRAEKAGMGLEKWMAEKDRRVQAEREAVQRARKLAEPRKPGLLRRLLDRAHRPI